MLESEQKQVSSEDWDLFRSPCCGQPLQNCKGGLRCDGCNQFYPVTDGIPVLLPSAAFTLCSDCGAVMARDMDGVTSCPDCGSPGEGEAL